MTSLLLDSPSASDLPPPQGGKLPDQYGENKSQSNYLVHNQDFPTSFDDKVKLESEVNYSVRTYDNNNDINSDKQAGNKTETPETSEKIKDYLNLKDYSSNSSETNEKSQAEIDLYLFNTV